MRDARSMKLQACLTFAALVAGAACSSTGGPATQDDPPVPPDPVPPSDPYPLTGFGTNARSGSRFGDRIANYKFLGYREGDDIDRGLQPIALAEYFDPSGSEHRLIHIQAVGVWSTLSKAQTKLVVPLKADLEARKVAWLVSLAEGPIPGTPARQRDLDGWVAHFELPYTIWLDPGGGNLGSFYDRAELPWNADIDARTMEILTSTTGAPKTTAEILDGIDEAIRISDERRLE